MLDSGMPDAPKTNDDLDPNELDAVKALLVGAAPEKRNEIEAAFEKYQPRFSIVGDQASDQHGSWVMEAGNYVHVRFNHRALRTFWLGCYIVWDCYAEMARAVDEGRPFDSTQPEIKLRHLHDLQNSESSLTANWPADVPDPRYFNREEHTHEEVAPAELSMIAVAWALLHEIRHIQAQQEGWSSTLLESSKKHEEEFECDRYGAEFLMDSVSVYVKESGEDEETVRLKRGLGIMFAVVVLGLL